jgi:hypothetical protein
MNTSPDQKYGGEVSIELPQVPINVLTNVMPEETDVPLIRQALRQINLERGINKRMMPALKAFLKPYTDILSSGFTGYNQLSALRKALATGDQEVDPAQQAMDTAVSTAQDYEPTEDEVLAYAVKHNIQAVTDDQKAYIKKLMKGDKDVQQPEPEKEKEPQMASKEYDNKPLEELKKLSGITESLGYADPGEDSEKVTYSKTKKQGDASVTISANADSMNELHDVLKLAGITLPDSDKKDQEHDHEGHDEIEKDHVEDGEKCDCCGNEVVDGECGCGPECPHCGGKPGDLPKDPEDKMMVISPNDASYSTDKQVLVNFLKDKLKKSIS